MHPAVQAEKEVVVGQSFEKICLSLGRDSCTISHAIQYKNHRVFVRRCLREHQCIEIPECQLRVGIPQSSLLPPLAMVVGVRAEGRYFEARNAQRMSNQATTASQNKRVFQCPG